MSARRSLPGPRCADGERSAAGSVAPMAWAMWLTAPVSATALAALWAWWRARPERIPTARAAMRDHRDYLAALVVPARGAARLQAGAARAGRPEVHD